MTRSEYEQKRAELTREVLDRYHYNAGIRVTGDRYFIAHCPKRLERLYYAFGCLVTAYVPHGGEESYIRNLRRVRNALRIQYQILKGVRFYERIVSFFRIPFG